MESSATALTEARGHLERISLRLRQGHKDLYHDLALYLQVLREELLPAVQQAVFHLATQMLPEHYGSLDSSERQALQGRLALLVHRCGCLLTLEQLVVLARQVQAERLRQRRQEQSRMFAALTRSVRGGPDVDEEPEQDGEPDEEEEGEEAEGSLAGPDPAGSVHLDLALPLSAELFAGGLPGLAGLTALTGSADEGAGEGIDGVEEEEDDDDLDDGDDSESWDGSRQDRDLARTPRSGDPADVLQTLLAMASASLDRQTGSRQPGSRQQRPGGATPPLTQERGGERDPSLLPGQPLQLLQWWEALDLALQRRLRNLSHAINLDLMRLGLTRGLLPVSLLDAVLQGQIEALPAPVNLLRLSLPYGPEGGTGQLDAHGLLLRPGDLEYVKPRLRTCRRRLERRRAEVRKMAQQYRHWQRRARSLEAEQQWLQDSRSTPPTPP